MRENDKREKQRGFEENENMERRLLSVSDFH